MSTNPMNLTVPVAGTTPGPLYATEVSSDLDIIAVHRHTGESNNDGYQVPTAGLDINEDLSFQSNNAISLRSTRFQNQSIILSGSGDVGCVYEKLGDLWYNNEDGYAVQITSGSSIIITPTGGYTTVETATNITIDAVDVFILVACDTTSNAITITLPLANTVSEGRFYIVKDASGNAVSKNITITPNGSNKIDESTLSQIIQNNFGGLCFVSDGASNWLLLPYAQVTSPQSSSTATITVPDITSDVFYVLDVSLNNVTVNLPSLSNIRDGLKVCVKDSGQSGLSIPSHSIIIVPNGSDEIEGINASKSIITAFGECNLVATSSGWFMV